MENHIFIPLFSELLQSVWQLNALYSEQCICNIGTQRTHGAWVHETDSLVSMMIKARKRVETWGCRRRHTLWLNVNHKWVNGILYNTQDEGKNKKQNRMKDTKHQTYCTVIWKKGLGCALFCN